jgi:Ca-activated chloride channel homolog
MVNLLLSLALAAGTPIGLRVELQPLGRGSTGTVVGVGLQVAPEDRGRVGEHVKVTLLARAGERVVDQWETAVTLEGDGSALLYREWPAGDVDVRVGMASLDGQASGGWTGKLKVPVMEAVFTAEPGASVDAVALAPQPPAEGVLEFLPPPRQAGVGAIQLEVKVPTGTVKVMFYQDQSELVTRQRAPWTVSVPLGEAAHRTTIRAEAYDASGAVLGEDALVLNSAGNQLAVEILLGAPGKGAEGQRVTVAVPLGAGVEDVLLKADDKVVAHWAGCPCVTTVAPEVWKGTKVLSAEAQGRGGVRGEAVKILGLQGFLAEVRVEEVELPVTVTDANGKLITGLGKEDFKVLEDGQEVPVEGFATTGSVPLSLGLAVDTSGSMKDPFPAVRRAIGQFAQAMLRPGDSLFAMTFSWEARIVMEWTGNGTLLTEALANAQPDGGTSLHDAVVRGLEQFHGRRGRTALVLLTDGDDTTSRTKWDAALRFAKTARTPVFPIGFRIGMLDIAIRNHMKALAELTGGEYFPAPKTGDLEAVYAQIAEQLRAQYLLSYRSPSTKGTDHFRTVKVTLAKPGLTARTIAGYYPTQ